jgi:methylated-DNA-[protein]-cysteine S-methyltransferase
MGEDSPGLPAIYEDAKVQVREYCQGQRKSFQLPLHLVGTEFQRRVWEQLRGIPFGETRSYGQLAKALGQPGAARAVGGACRSNPVGVIVPCHRVIGADGKLVGFGGQTEDLSLKRALIDHESRALMTSLEDFD